MLECLSAAGLEKSVCNMVRCVSASKAALCLLGLSSAGLERGCSLWEGGQLAGLTAQAFPSTGMKITSGVCADLTAHPLPPTLLSLLIQTVAFAGISCRPKFKSLSSPIIVKWLISFFVSRFYFRHLEQVCTKAIITANVSLLVPASTVGDFCGLWCVHHTLLALAVLWLRKQDSSVSLFPWMLCSVSCPKAGAEILCTLMVPGCSCTFMMDIQMSHRILISNPGISKESSRGFLKFLTSLKTALNSQNFLCNLEEL